ncbi:MAG: MaoC family dehydratase [Stackebrandtia sp.]
MKRHRLSAPPRVGVLLPKAAMSGLRRRGDASAALPSVELALDDVAVDAERLARYSRVCGLRLSDRLPVTYPHILGFPLTLRLFADPAFPWPVAGLVHVSDRITQHRPIPVGARLALRSRAEAPRPHRKGVVFDVTTEADVDSETVWTEQTTYLRRVSGGSQTAEHSASPQVDDSVATSPPAALWRVGSGVGRAYAAVTGDYNPIHLSRVSARLFGMRRPMAHGMWSLARCLGALEGRLPEPALRVEARFRDPVPLPSSAVGFHFRAEGEGVSFAVTHPRADRPCLVGAAQPAA